MIEINTKATDIPHQSVSRPFSYPPYLFRRTIIRKMNNQTQKPFPMHPIFLPHPQIKRSDSHVSGIDILASSSILGLLRSLLLCQLSLLTLGFLPHYFLLLIFQSTLIALCREEIIIPKPGTNSPEVARLMFSADAHLVLIANIDVSVAHFEDGFFRRMG